MKKVLSVICVILSAPTYAQKITTDDVMKKVSTGKPYTFVMLKTGKALPGDKDTVQKMQMEHLVNLFQMEQDGKISIFGPISNNEVFRGIIIFNSADTNYVKQELNADPYVQAGYMAYDLYPWFSIPGQKLP